MMFMSIMISYYIAIGRDQRDFRQRDCTDNLGVMRFAMF